MLFPGKMLSTLVPGLLLLEASLAPATEMRAVFLSTQTFSTGDYTSANSEAALRLYKSMGYNTVFEQITAPGDSMWNLPANGAWTIIPAESQALINRIKAQNERIKALGMEYCPFFSEWGWDNGTGQVSERALAAVHREVLIEGNYGDKYSSLIKTKSWWPDPCGGGCSANWSTGPEKVVISQPNLNGTVGANITMTKGSLGTQLRPRQCYTFTAKISLGANLQIGDVIRTRIYQEFATGQQPNWSTPLGHILYPGTVPTGNRYIPMSTRSALIEGVSGGTYVVNDEDKKFTNHLHPHLCGPAAPCNSFTLQMKVWTEDSLVLGSKHAFSNNFRWEFELNTLGAARGGPAVVEVSDFEIRSIDPRLELAYPDWEQNFSTLGGTDEQSYMRTKAFYLNTVAPYQIDSGDYFAPPPSGFLLYYIRGHFKPTYEAQGQPVLRHSLDPLSPAYDLVAKEMLRNIREGLKVGSTYQEPKYWHLNGDEVFTFRKDNLSRFGGSHPSYKDKTNGQFYASVIESWIRRYKLVFQGSETAASTAKFVFSGDMVLPFEHGYGLYSPSFYSNDALVYLRNRINAGQLSADIMPIIWIYDNSKIKYDMDSTVTNHNQFLLKKPTAIQVPIDMVKSQGFKFLVCYSTAGFMNQLQENDPTILTHSQHIQNEFEMARDWRNIVQSPGNPSSFGGYIYAGWWGCIRENFWNGLYPLAYFGWMNKSATSAPAFYQNMAPALDPQGQPVLDLLRRNVWPPVAVMPAVDLLK